MSIHHGDSLEVLRTLEAESVGAHVIGSIQARARSLARQWGYNNDADDFAQEAAIKLLSGRRASLTQLFIDYLREQYGDSGIRRGDCRSNEFFESQPSGETDPGRDSGDEPTAWGDRRRLTERQAFALKKFLEGHSKTSIARQMGVSVSRVSNILLHQVPANTNATAAAVRKPKPVLAEPRFSLDAVVREHIETVLAFNDGNRTHTARDLGISLRGLRNKLHEYGLMGSDAGMGSEWVRPSSLPLSRKG